MLVKGCEVNAAVGTDDEKLVNPADAVSELWCPTKELWRCEVVPRPVNPVRPVVFGPYAEWVSTDDAAVPYKAEGAEKAVMDVGTDGSWYDMAEVLHATLDEG